MKTALLTCHLLLLASSLLAQVPFAWDADSSAAAPARKDVYRGESVDLRPFWTGEGVSTNGAAFTLYWQTNGMGSAWWGDPTNAFRWTPARDCGAAEYTMFIRCQTAAGASYRANARLRMLFSPGFVPSVLPPPSCYPTLAADLLPLLAPSLPTYGAWTNEAAVRASADSVLQLQIDGISAATGTQATASSSFDSAVWRDSRDTNVFARLENGTGTVYRTCRQWAVVAATTLISYPSTTVATAGVYYLSGALLPVPTNATYYSPGLSGSVVVSGTSVSYYSGLWANYNADYPGGQVSLTRALNGGGTAWLGYLARTNLLATFGYSGSATEDLASNAWLRAGSALDANAATAASLAAATNHIIRTYLITSNAWITADFSNAVIAVTMVVAGVTNTVTCGAGGSAGIDPEATNLLWQAIAFDRSRLNGLGEDIGRKADKAWGKYTPDGAANPDPAYMTWLNAPATVFASGCSWTTYGTYAALTTAGTVAFESGGDGAFRLGPDSTNWFGYVSGGSVTVGAIPGRIEITAGGTSNGIAEIVYQYAGGDFPALWFSPSLTIDFTAMPGVIWTDNLDGTATVTAPATSSAGFFKATTSATFMNFFETTMPCRLRGGVIGSTNALPVIYDATITVTSGGKSYRLPAQEVAP